MRLQTVTLVFLLLVVCAPVVLAETINYNAGTIDNPRPTINITYQPSDAPIILRNYELIGPDGNPVLDQDNQAVVEETGHWMVYLPSSPEGSNAWDKYQFKITKFLPAGNYHLIITGEKYDPRAPIGSGKEHILDISMTVDGETMRMWVSSPRISQIEPAEEQDVAVSSAQSFTLEMKTEFETTCTIQREPTTDYTPSSQYFQGNYFNNNNGVPTTTHRILAFDQSLLGSPIEGTSDSYEQNDVSLTLRGPFDYGTYDRSANYLIICRQDRVSGPLYHEKILYVGYDLTAPIITASFTPDLLEDSQEMTTTLGISSQGDLMACSYLFTDQPPIEISAKPLPTVTHWITEQFTGIADYTTELTDNFEMDQGLVSDYFSYALNTPYYFGARITCENLAGLSTQQETGFTIELTDDLTFTITNSEGKTLYDNYDLYSSLRPAVDVKTNILSTCEYLRDGSSALIDTEPSLTHTFTISGVADDTYGAQATLQCQIPGSDAYYQKTLPVALDSHAPSAPLFDAPDYTCDGSIGVDVIPPVNNYQTQPYLYGDKVQYIYALYEDGELLGSGTTLFTGTGLHLDENLLGITLGLGDYGKEYEWEVTATDGAGKTSQTSSVAIQRLHENDYQCDTQAPVGNYQAILSTQGYEVSVTCDDPEENCAGTYLYAQLPLGGDCDSARLQATPLSTKLVFGSDSLFCFQVRDLAQPQEHTSPVYAIPITPEVNIQLESPASGIGTTTSFDMVVNTLSKDNRAMTCKQGPLSKSISDLLAQRDYAGIYSQGSLALFDQTDSTQHVFSFNAQTTSPFDYYYTPDLEVHIEPWVIACKEEGTTVYPVKVFDLGFDRSPPQITVSAQPIPVQNPLDMSTILSVESDEPTFCEYRDIKNNEQIYHPFNPSEFENYDTYSTSHEDSISYELQDILDVTQEVRCYNLAGLSATKTVSYQVQAQGDIEVIINADDIYNTPYILLEARTPGQWADCQISVDRTDFKDFNIATGQQALDYTHEHQLSLEDGTHDIAVKCDAWFDGSIGFANKQITVDTKQPTITAQVKDPTCSLTTVEFLLALSGTGTDIAQATYEIADTQDQILASATINEVSTEVTSLSLVPSQVYFLDITATDEAGNTKTSTTSFAASDATANQCDSTPPESSISVEDVYGGVEVTITCTDADSGCSDTFYYYFDETGTCENPEPNQIQSASYTDLPLFVDSTTTLCYFVTDEQANPSSIEKVSLEVITTCYNGVQDTDEEGLDCGGVCALQDCTICENNLYDAQWEESTDCGLVCAVSCEEVVCENGVQDPGEESVDCGGICSAVRSCENPLGDDALCYNGIQDADEEDVDCGGTCSLSCEDAAAQELSIKIITPEFGLASTKNFTFEVYTTQPATCRQGPLLNARPSDTTDWYVTLQDFAQSNGRTHSLTIYTQDYIQFDQPGDVVTTPWVVICQGNESTVVEEIDEFGYDLSPAIITVSAQPNPVVDPGNAVTTLSVTSDDPVACTYQDQNGISHYFSGEDVNDALSYGTEHEVTLSYWGVHDFSHTSLISCRNLAQALSEESITLTVALTNEAGISSNMEEFYATSQVPLSVSTEHLATCQYRLSPDEAFQDLGASVTNEHEKTISLEEGENTIQVQCVSESTGILSEIDVKVVVDTVSPLMELQTLSQSCGLDGISFTMLADGTGSLIDHFEYNLTKDGQEIASGVSDHSVAFLPASLIENETYTLKATAYDQAGNEITQQASIVASTFDDLICDTIAPRGSVTLDQTWQGVEATITCTDSDSGCSDTFLYETTDLLCSGQGSIAQYNTDLPLIIREQTTLCYTVFDQANNQYNDSVAINYEPHCFNGFEDPSEEGVDCGGTCIAECGTCDNGIKDPFEEGVDCGGVCETITSCTDIETLYGNNASSFLDVDEDGLADDWEEYYFGNLNHTGDEDYDGDGFTNLEEFLNGTDPTVFDKRPECTVDSDCPTGYVCDYTYSCVEGIGTEGLDTGINLLGLIFIILGILLMGGGIGYIIYSRRQLAQQQNNGLSDKERRQQEAALLAQRKKQEEERAVALKKREEAQVKARKQRIEERKKQRESLIGTFDQKKIAKKETAQKSEEKTEEPETPKEDEKLDKGLKGDYVDVRRLGKQKKKTPAKKNIVKKSQEDVFEALSKMTNQSKQKTTTKKK
ncbi:MAG: Ig-like domain repeat protein [Nanoarchaeota archaeon]|nr:Ig-like domain repeat protein [Nanoarchaeota archaeon]